MTKTPQEKANIVMALLRSGQLDDYLVTIGEQCNQRLRTVGFNKANRLQVGDLITISQSCKPRMLAGRRAEVIDFTPTRVVVRLMDNINSRWNTRTRVRLPVTLIDQIPSKED